MFTERQKRIGKMLVNGVDIKEIAHALNMSYSTCYNEIGRMRVKAQSDNHWKLIVFLGKNEKELLDGDN